MKILILVLGLILLAGCIRTDHLLLTDQPVIPVSDTHPIVFFSKPPERSYIKIAIVEAKRARKWEDLREALKQEARSIGADAVAIVGPYYYSDHNEYEIIEHYRVVDQATEPPVLV